MNLTKKCIKDFSFYLFCYMTVTDTQHVRGKFGFLALWSLYWVDSQLYQNDNMKLK